MKILPISPSFSAFRLVTNCRYPFTAIVALTAISFTSVAQTQTGQLKKTAARNAHGSQIEQSSPPALGNYPATSIALSADGIVTPDSNPIGAARITVTTSSDFDGTLEGDPATGVVRISNAHPAVLTPPGSYTVTIRAFSTTGAIASKTFALTVTTPPTCNPVAFAPAANVTTGHYPGAVAVGDFDGDGNQDLAVAESDNPSGVSILLGDGAGGFSPGPGSPFYGGNPASLAVVDFDGDGNQDLALAYLGSPGYVVILKGNGTGAFSFFSSTSGVLAPYWMAVGDFNRDGKPDLAVANYNSSNVSILLGDGTGRFTSTTNFSAGSFPTSVAVGDFNRDGKQD
nr:VCBS repeat-containing protein [Verrucomicrobiota bacterium]